MPIPNIFTIEFFNSVPRKILEGVMPDDISVIGSSGKAPGVFHAFGFSAHGFQLGPIVGKIIADLTINGRTDLPIHPFRIERFTEKKL